MKEDGGDHGGRSKVQRTQLLTLKQAGNSTIDAVGVKLKRDLHAAIAEQEALGKSIDYGDLKREQIDVQSIKLKKGMTKAIVTQNEEKIYYEY